MSNTIKKATVVAVEGKVVTINLSGNKITADNDPRKGQLAPETRIDVRESRISLVTDGDRAGAKDIHTPDIKPGDQLSCSWSDDRDVPTPQNVTLYRDTKAQAKREKAPLTAGTILPASEAARRFGKGTDAKAEDAGTDDADAVNAADADAPEDYDALTVAQLKERADAEGVEVDGTHKADFVKAFQARDRKARRAAR